MAPVEEEVPGKADRSAEILEHAGIPILGPEVRAHLCCDRGAKVADGDGIRQEGCGPELRPAYSERIRPGIPR
jgi:hypothetical protein